MRRGKINSADCPFCPNYVRNGRGWHRLVTKENPKCVLGDDVCAPFGKLLTQESGIVSHHHEVAEWVGCYEMRTNGTRNGSDAGEREFISNNRTPTRCPESNRHCCYLRICLTEMCVSPQDTRYSVGSNPNGMCFRHRQSVDSQQFRARFAECSTRA